MKNSNELKMLQQLKSVLLVRTQGWETKKIA